MACWCSSFILIGSCCQTWWNNTLQQCVLKSFGFGCWLKNNSSYIPFSLMYRCSLYKYLGQLPVVPAVGTTANWFLCWIFWLVQWYLTTPLTAFSYFNALHTSLAKIQSLSLMVTTHNSTALKVNGMTEDIFFSSCLWRNICVSITDIKFFTKLSVIISIHSPTHSWRTWVFYWICINSSRTKALSGPSCKWYRTRLRGCCTTPSSQYIFLLQINSVAHLFWSPCCCPGW